MERGTKRPPHVDLDRMPYFVSTQVADRRHLFVGDMAVTAIDQLLADRRRYDFLLLAYVFMPDHAHFVLVPTEGHSISATMRVIKGGIARRINQLSGAKGAIWQEGFYDKMARTLQQLNAYIEYTHRNPVAAGLVSSEGAYKFSSGDGKCMADYDHFLSGEVASSSGSARAGKPALREHAV